MFSFEAGRRCDSGPGTFTFETKQGNEIFILVDQAIQSQKAMAEERHLSCPMNFDPDCPASLQHIRNAASGGDSSSCSSREADGDSGGSKPGSADGVLGKREGGDGAGGRGGHKGRSLPEPPVLLGVVGGGGTPPRSPRILTGKGASPDEGSGLYSEPADSVRLPLNSADGLYSDPVDSIKAQNQPCNPTTPPVPTPRLRPIGDDTSGEGNGNHRKPPDLYSHVYDRISVELNQKTGALNLNGAAGAGRGGGRGVNNNRRPPGGQAEGASLPPVSNSEHIYDEPEGCASLPASSGMSLYDEAHSANPAGVEQRHSPPQPGQGRGTPLPPAPKWPKPVTAPKPVRNIFARKEPMPLPPGKPAGPGSNVNNNNNIKGNGGGAKELYSKVSKQKPYVNLWNSQNHQAPLRTPDIIYDNLGDI